MTRPGSVTLPVCFVSVKDFGRGPRLGLESGSTGPTGSRSPGGVVGEPRNRHWILTKFDEFWVSSIGGLGQSGSSGGQVWSEVGIRAGVGISQGSHTAVRESAVRVVSI